MSRLDRGVLGIAALWGIDEKISAELAEFAGMGGLNEQVEHFTERGVTTDHRCSSM